MVSGYDDAGQVAWLEQRRASTCSAARDASTAPGASPSATAPTRAAHIVIATGSDPVIPPIPGLRELDGVWTTARRPA